MPIAAGGLCHQKSLPRTTHSRPLRAERDRCEMAATLIVGEIRRVVPSSRSAQFAEQPKPAYKV